MNEGPFVIRVNCGGQFLLNPGSGRDLKVSLGALVAIDAAHAMIDAGIPVRVIGPYTSLFALRALELLQLANAFNIEPSALSRDDFARAPPDFRRNEWLLCFPVAEREGEWRAFIFYDGVPFDPWIWPVAFAVLQVDQIILQTFRRLRAALRGERREPHASMKALGKRQYGGFPEFAENVPGVRSDRK